MKHYYESGTHLLAVWSMLAILCYGCVETSSFSPEVEPEVVVNCLLTDSDVQTLTLTYSAHFADFSYKEVEAAEVTLLEQGRVVGQFRKVDKSKWELPFTPHQGLSYELRVTVPGRPLISATTTFPRYPKVLIDWSKAHKREEKGQVYFERSYKDQIFWVFAFQDDYFHEDNSFITTLKIKPNYRLIRELGTDYPSVDDFNNIDIKPDMYDNTTDLKQWYLRMLPDEQRSFYVETLDRNFLIVFRATSDEYDKYLKSSVTKMLVYLTKDDLTQRLDETEIYTNVQNGLGIFGAYIDQRYYFSGVYVVVNEGEIRFIDE